MKIKPLWLAGLLVNAPLSTPFQFGPLQNGSKLRTPEPSLVAFGMTAQTKDADEGNVVMDTEDELKLTKSKLKVLQLVVKKMKKKSEKSSAQWEKRMAQEKQRQTKTLGDLESVQKRLASAESALTNEKKRHEKQIETLTSDYETSLSKSAKKISDLIKREVSYNRDLKAYETKAIQMEEKIALMAEDRRKMEADCKNELNRHKTILDNQRRKEEELSAELDDVYAERDEFIAKLEETRQRRSVDVEAVERAQRSLAASEEKASIIQGKYTALLAECDASQQMIQELRQKIAAIEERNRFLEDKVQSAPKVIDTGLQEEIEMLRGTIVELRMQHNSQLKKQQRETEMQLARMRDEHYKQVQQYRKDVMERNDTAENKGLWQRVRTVFRRK
jgi:chromosome segregation ATPase